MRRGGVQDPDLSRSQPNRKGEIIPPIWPREFITPAIAPAFCLPRSMQVAQQTARIRSAAPKLAARAATAGAFAGVKAAAVNRMAEASRPEMAGIRRPQRSPKRLTRESVQYPPAVLAAAPMSSGKAAATPTPAHDMPRCCRRYVGSQVK